MLASRTVWTFFSCVIASLMESSLVGKSLGNLEKVAWSFRISSRRSHRLRGGTPRVSYDTYRQAAEHVVNKWRLSLGSHCGSLISWFDIHGIQPWYCGSLVSFTGASFRYSLVTLAALTSEMSDWSKTVWDWGTWNHIQRETASSSFGPFPERVEQQFLKLILPGLKNFAALNFRV